MEKHLVLVNSKNDLQELDLRQKMIQQLDYEFFANFESEHTRKSYRKDIQQFLELITTDFRITSYNVCYTKLLRLSKFYSDKGENAGH